MRHPIRAVLIANTLILAVNIAGTCRLAYQSKVNEEQSIAEQGMYSTLIITSKKSREAILEEIREELPIDEYLNGTATNVLSDKGFVVAYDDISEGAIEESIVIESVSMRGVHGGRIETDPVEIKVMQLAEISEQEYEVPEWDFKERINTIQILWDFLVNQQGVSKQNASAIIGSICCEGDFGQKEGSKKCLNNIEEARKVLGNGEEGYGLVQWTYGSRQATLLKYYEMANEQYPDNWEQARMIAECCMLLEELKAYEIFDDIYTDTTIEDALGRLSRNYFKYENYWEDWNSSNVLIRETGGGKSRLNYATSIYGYFTDIYS